MPGLVRTNVGGGDQRWLASAHALENARSAVLDVSAFTKGTHYPEGYFPSGLELNVADESTVTPWTGAAGEKLGYLKENVSTLGRDGSEDVNVAYLWHGAINVAYLPVEHVEAGTGEDGGGSTTNFTFIEGSDD